MPLAIMVPHALSLAAVPLLLAALAVAAPAAPAGTCVANTPVDPLDKVRNGHDFESVEMPSGSNITACIAACCANPACVALSFNDPQPGAYLGCAAGSICCLLKDTSEPLTNNTYGPAVRTAEVAKPPQPLPTPSAGQAEYMGQMPDGRGFTQFMHFSVTTFGNIEHDCVNGKCLSPSLFNPSNISTDQWVATAAAMGAGEVVLTAHHEGGFCLWPSRFSNYSIAASPYLGGKGDIVRDFVASCHKHHVRPSFYIGPNANGYFTQVLQLTPAEFVKQQLGMFRELLTSYGPVYRLWWDHYEQGCGGLSECPGGFPEAWPEFVDLVHEVSPSTLIGTGPDIGHSMGGESGVGSYPIWNNCNTTDGSAVARCRSYGPRGAVFRPREADATIQNPGDAWFWKANHSYWKAADLWTHYFETVGRGDAFILNMPPDTTGQIPAAYVAEATRFGDALRASFAKPVGSVAGPAAGLSCGDGAAPLELDLGSATAVNAVRGVEAMSTHGQRIGGYKVEYQTAGGAWAPATGVHGQTVGFNVVDFIGSVTTSKLRWTCVNATEQPVFLTAFSAYAASPPSQ